MAGFLRTLWKLESTKLEFSVAESCLANTKVACKSTVNSDFSYKFILHPFKHLTVFWNSLSKYNVYMFVWFWGGAGGMFLFLWLILWNCGTCKYSNAANCGDDTLQLRLMMHVPVQRAAWKQSSSVRWMSYPAGAGSEAPEQLFSLCSDHFLCSMVKFTTKILATLLNRKKVFQVFFSVHAVAIAVWQQTRISHF